MKDITREELIQSKEYWVTTIQLRLFAEVEAFMKSHQMNRTQFAEYLGCTKGYVTQLLSGDYDNKISKLVELSLAIGRVPKLEFVDTDSFIARDKAIYIARLETNQFAIFPEKFNSLEPVGVNSSYEFSISADLSSIRCRSTFHYVQGDNVLMVLEMGAIFAIAPEGVSEIKAKGTVPVDFLRYMGTIVVGAARGIIHAKTEGTVLNSVILPPINLVEIIKEDLVLEK